jgi:hypothetical protein
MIFSPDNQGQHAIVTKSAGGEKGNKILCGGVLRNAPTRKTYPDVVQTGQPYWFRLHSVLAHGPPEQGNAAMQSSHVANSQPVPVLVLVVGSWQKQVTQPNAFCQQSQTLHVGQHEMLS